MFSVRRNHKKEKTVILLYSHARAQEEEVWGRHGGSPQIIPKIIISYNRFMDSICSSDMLYTYLDERRTVHYWKKGTFQYHSQDGAE
jgi:hypothetical protein